jgi:hypothetical protein
MAVKLAVSDSTRYIWILRKGNGQAFVSPSPALLKEGCYVTVLNKTTDTASVSFPSGVIRPRAFSIRPGSSKKVEVLDTSGYFEYDVSFKRANPPFYAEGGSKPGVIVEH